MQNGIFHVRFTSSLGGFGEGLLVLKQGSVNGGDSGYLYTGYFSVDGDNVAGRLNIRRWKYGHVSVFGPLEDFNLQLTGKANNNEFNLSGGIAGQAVPTISIEGRFLVPAA